MDSTTTRPNRSSGRGDAPFLSIVTRHLTTRTELLERLVSSIKSQTDADLEHIILTDDEGRGLGWANQQFARHKDLPEGRYVMMLDDDDWLADEHAVEDLKDYATILEATTLEYPVAIVYFDYRGPAVGYLPSEEMTKIWQPVPGHISGQGLIVRTDVWKELIHHFDDSYEGDFHFIKAVWERASNRPEFLPYLITSTDKQRQGESE